jgi:uncharacterized protein (DUF2384 family)
MLTAPHPSRDQLLRGLRSLVDALEESPVPDSEWRPLSVILEPERLARLVGISASSLHRYAAGERPTPDDVAARLHVLAKIVGDLLGAYNEIGARRWFDRRRSALKERSPAELLEGSWDPDGEEASSVRDLARSLTVCSGGSVIRIATDGLGPDRGRPVLDAVR